MKTSLIREKITIQDRNAKGDDTLVQEIARNNRIEIPYYDQRGVMVEKLVVRAQTMHVAVRFAACIVQAHTQGGPIVHRAQRFDWDDAWHKVIEAYELGSNPHVWGAVYSGADVLFESGTRHPLLDIIEKCEAYNKHDYDHAVQLAEQSFKKIAENVSIEYDSNIAMVMQSSDDRGRCGIMFRHAQRTTTFQINIGMKNNLKVSPVSCLNISAAFLEGIQLAYKGATYQHKIDIEDLKSGSQEARNLSKIKKRLRDLKAELQTAENQNDMRYRLERPDFFDILEQTTRVFEEQSLRRQQQDEAEKQLRDTIMSDD